MQSDHTYFDEPDIQATKFFDMESASFALCSETFGVTFVTSFHTFRVAAFNGA